MGLAVLKATVLQVSASATHSAEEIAAMAPVTWSDWERALLNLHSWSPVSPQSLAATIKAVRDLLTRIEYQRDWSGL